MILLTELLIATISLLHFYILIMEMFLWTKPRTLKVFNITKEEAETSKTLAANMGLYNGFLAMGLTYGLIENSVEFKIYFLLCIAIAGIYGGITAANKRIFIIQSVPAILAALLLIYS